MEHFTSDPSDQIFNSHDYFTTRPGPPDVEGTYNMKELARKFKYTSSPSILLSIMTIALNIFVINFYRKTEITVVPLLYTLIASMDILCAVGTIYQYITLNIYFKFKLQRDTPFDVNAVIFLLFMQIGYRCSVFCNLVLAVCRTIMIAKPFYEINLKAVKLTCTLYAAPWIAIYGFRTYVFYVTRNPDCHSYFDYVYLGGYIISAGLCYGSGSDVNIDIIYILPEMLVFMIPVMIVFVTCVIQIISIWKSSQFPTSSNQRHVTITVLLMSTLFVACNTPLCVNTVIWMFLIRPYGTWLYQHYHDHNMLFATILSLLNGFFNPVIIITRSSEIRRKFTDSFQSMKSWIQERTRLILWH